MLNCKNYCTFVTYNNIKPTTTMKAFFKNTKFKYIEDPFSQIGCHLSYGHNQNSRAFIPCKATLDPDGNLIDDQFKLVRTKEKNTLLIVEGIDTTNRALCFVGAEEGFRGSVDIKGQKNCEILCQAQAGNACKGSIQVACLLEKGGYIDFHTQGRRTDEVLSYHFDGNDLLCTSYYIEEYNVLTEHIVPIFSPEDYDDV